MPSRYNFIKNVWSVCCQVTTPPSIKLLDLDKANN